MLIFPCTMCLSIRHTTDSKNEHITQKKRENRIKE